MIWRFKRSVRVWAWSQSAYVPTLALFCTNHANLGNLLSILASFLLLYNEHSKNSHLIKLYYLYKLTHGKEPNKFSL